MQRAPRDMGFGAWDLPVGLWQAETILVDRRDFVRGCRRSQGEVRGAVGGGDVVLGQGLGVSTGTGMVRCWYVYV